jgi:hypothetical protein
MSAVSFLPLGGGWVLIGNVSTNGIHWLEQWTLCSPEKGVFPMSHRIGSPNPMEGRLLVELPNAPMSRFDIIDAIQDGATLVLQCAPSEHEDSAESSVPPAAPAKRLAVTEVVQEGTSLVLQCQPKGAKEDDAPRTRQDDHSHVYYPNERREGLSCHDPRLLYEDLR